MDEKYREASVLGRAGCRLQGRRRRQVFRTPEQRKQQEDPTWKLANRADGFYGAAPKMEGTYSDGNATSAGSQPEEFFESLKPEDKELLNAYDIKHGRTSSHRRRRPGLLSA